MTQDDRPIEIQTADPQKILAGMESIALSLSATQEALAECLDVAVGQRNASHRDSSLPHPALRAVAEVALLLETSRERLLGSVRTIPAKAEYAPFAARLREIAGSNRALDVLIGQAPQLTAPLADSVPVLMQIADDLKAGRDRLLEAGRGLRTGPPTLPPSPQAPTPSPDVSELLRELVKGIAPLDAIVHDLREVSGGLRTSCDELTQTANDRPAELERALTPVRELGPLLSALANAVIRLEVLPQKLAEAARALPVPEERVSTAGLAAEIEAVSASLRAVAAIADPLVDSLSDLSQLTTPVAEKLRGLDETAASPTPSAHTVPAPTDGNVEWALDILRAVRELKQAITRSPRPSAETEQRLWESVRQLQTEIVNLQGALLSPAQKALPEEHL